MEQKYIFPNTNLLIIHLLFVIPRFTMFKITVKNLFCYREFVHQNIGRGVITYAQIIGKFCKRIFL